MAQVVRANLKKRMYEDERLAEIEVSLPLPLVNLRRCSSQGHKIPVVYNLPSKRGDGPACAAGGERQAPLLDVENHGGP